MVNFLLQLFAPIHLADFQAVVKLLRYDSGVQDVLIVLDGILGTAEWLVGGQSHLMRVVNEGIAGYTCGRLVGTGEAAVDDEEASIALDGTLTVLALDRHMAVDDMAVWTFQTKFFEDLDAAFLRLGDLIIGILILFPCRLVINKSTLECRDLGTGEERRPLAAPEVPHEVLTLLAARGSLGAEVTFAGLLFAVFHEGFALISLPVKREFLEGAICIHGDTAMGQEIPVVDFVDIAFAEQELDMVLQFLTLAERAD